MRAALIEVSRAWAASPLEFFARLDAPLERAAREGAQLAVLPAGVGDLLAGIPVPAEPSVSRDGLARAGGFDSWVACVREIAPVTSAFYVHTFESLARRHHLLIAAGTIHLPAPAAGSGPSPVFNAAFLFGADGQVLGEQRQMRPAPGDAPALSYGEAVRVWPTALARLGMLVDADFYARDLLMAMLAQDAQAIVHLKTSVPGAGAEPSAGVWLARDVAATPGEETVVREGFDPPLDASGGAVAADLRLDADSRVVVIDFALK